MTPESQRIAIAEACGWTHVRPAACQRMDVEELQPCMKRVDELLARESILTASNEDLAAQLMEAKADNQSLRFRIGCLENEHVGHEQDYLAVWKLIKRPDETVVQAVERTVKERGEVTAQVVKLTERVEKLDRAFDAASNASEQRIKIAADMIQRGVDSERDLRALATRLAEELCNFDAEAYSAACDMNPIAEVVTRHNSVLADARKVGLLPP